MLRSDRQEKRRKSRHKPAGLDNRKKKRINIMLEKWKMNRRRKAELKRIMARLRSLQMRLSRKTMRMEPVEDRGSGCDAED